MAPSQNVGKNITSERRLVVSSLGLRGKSPVPQRRATGWPREVGGGEHGYGYV